MSSAWWRESFGSVEVFWIDEEAVQNPLEDWIGEPAQRAEVLAVVLFGSFAQGRAVPGSDLDILLVLKDYPKPFPDRVVEYLERLPLPVDVFPYPLLEIATGQKLAWKALETGKILWQRPGFHLLSVVSRR